MTDTITIVRHLRTHNQTILSSDGLQIGGISNLGGITFVFEMIHNPVAELSPAGGQATRTSVRYAYAQCRNDDNFDKAAGTSIALDKLFKNDAIVLDEYYPSETLIDNVWVDLHKKAAAQDPIFKEKKLYRLRSAMKKISTVGNGIDELLNLFGLDTEEGEQ